MNFEKVHILAFVINFCATQLESKVVFKPIKFEIVIIEYFSQKSPSNRGYLYFDIVIRLGTLKVLG